MKKTTIKDIAVKIGVSPSTISRALSDHPDISDSLKIKIQEIARKLKYRPSAAALHLKRGTNKNIALILPQITSFFYPSVIHGMEEILHQQGYTLIILPTNDLYEREIENIDIALDQNVAGVIIAVSKETNNTDHFVVLQEAAIPIILIDKIIENANITTITIDDFKVSYQMVQHLYKTGCRNIAGIFGKARQSITHQRYNGYAQALRDLNLNILEDQVFFVNSSSDAYQKCDLLLSNYSPDGLYLMTDEIMLGAMPAINKKGLKVPDDISVIAISDGYLAQYMLPRVSHMKHDGYELGNLSAQKIIQYINNKQHNIPINSTEKIMMNTNIVLFESTR
ncbi:MAG: LacI family DNA-binding transcriptional regulator [Saprospiraceae bacterium]